jgi:hypothetical protein
MHSSNHPVLLLEFLRAAGPAPLCQRKSEWDASANACSGTWGGMQ